jgi:hypothetical protein
VRSHPKFASEGLKSVEEDRKTPSASCRPNIVVGDHCPSFLLLSSSLSTLLSNFLSYTHLKFYRIGSHLFKTYEWDTSLRTSAEFSSSISLFITLPPTTPLLCIRSKGVRRHMDPQLPWGSCHNAHRGNCLSYIPTTLPSCSSLLVAPSYLLHLLSNSGVVDGEYSRIERGLFGVSIRLTSIKIYWALTKTEAGLQKDNKQAPSRGSREGWSKMKFEKLKRHSSPVWGRKSTCNLTTSKNGVAPMGWWATASIKHL